MHAHARMCAQAHTHTQSFTLCPLSVQPMISSILRSVPLTGLVNLEFNTTCLETKWVNLSTSVFTTVATYLEGFYQL